MRAAATAGKRKPGAVVVALTAVGLIAVCPHPSLAAQAMKCPFVADDEGDAFDAEQSPAADLVSVDLGSDRTTMTIAVGYAGNDTVAVPTKGHQYVVTVSTGEMSYQVNAGVTSDNAWFELRRRGDSADSSAGVNGSTWIWVASLKGAVDRRRHRVVMSFPLSLTDGEISPRRRVTVRAMAVPGVGISTLPEAAASPTTAGGATGVWSASSDDTHESRPYVVGERGCVPVWRG